MRLPVYLFHTLVPCSIVLLLVSVSNGQGVFLPASGAINRSMGGATTGAAVESIGSMAWNPATISGLGNEVGIGFEGLYSDYKIDSSIPGWAGSTSAENGVSPVPTAAWVYQTRNPNVKMGVGMFGVAGFCANFSADSNNPVLALGIRAQGEAVFYQIPLVFSVRLNDCWAIAAGPTLAMGRISLNQNIFAANNSGLSQSPRGNGTRYHFGGGGQLGLYYTPNDCWSFGACIKTPTWMETFRYHSEDSSGAPKVDKVNFDLPMMVSFGAGYRPNQDLLWTADMRFTDYTNSEGFGDPAQVQANGAVSGLGWKSLFSAHVGARARLSDRCYGSAGYVYCSKLIPDESTVFNLGTDLGYRNGVALGGTWMCSSNVGLSVAYNYFFEWGSSDLLPLLPGLDMEIGQRVSAQSLTFGLNVAY
ncbi:MAG: outer membrane protein transport protein [Mariniblastus sp.]|nr:outer membrane protein transport protein [Mariniblastus sp.]